MDIKTLLFSFDGRIGRWMYFKLFSFSYLMMTIFILIMVNIFNNMFGAILLLIFTISYVWLSFALIIKRLHDVNKSGWLSLLSFIPLINLFLGLYLLFVKGTMGANQYGEDLLNQNLNKEVEDGNI